MTGFHVVHPRDDYNEVWVPYEIAMKDTPAANGLVFRNRNKYNFVPFHPFNITKVFDLFIKDLCNILTACGGYNSIFPK